MPLRGTKKKDGRKCKLKSGKNDKGNDKME
jgi:hypothetical protein